MLKRVRVDHWSNEVATNFSCTFAEALIAKLVHLNCLSAFEQMSEQMSTWRSIDAQICDEVRNPLHPACFQDQSYIRLEKGFRHW